MLIPARAGCRGKKLTTVEKFALSLFHPNLSVPTGRIFHRSERHSGACLLAPRGSQQRVIPPSEVNGGEIRLGFTCSLLALYQPLCPGLVPGQDALRKALACGVVPRMCRIFAQAGSRRQGGGFGQDPHPLGSQGAPCSRRWHEKRSLSPRACACRLIPPAPRRLSRKPASLRRRSHSRRHGDTTATSAG